MVLLGGKILASLFIAYGDFKERKILLLVLIGLFIINGLESFLFVDSVEVLTLILVNISVISIIFGLTYLYFNKVRKVPNPSQTHLGIGDWLFFITLSPLFPTSVFIYVFLLMNVISLVVAIIATVIKNGKYEIPYAGISAVVFIVISVIQYMYPLEILSLI